MIAEADLEDLSNDTALSPTHSGYLTSSDSNAAIEPSPAIASIAPKPAIGAIGYKSRPALMGLPAQPSMTFSLMIEHLM